MSREPSALVKGLAFDSDTGTFWVAPDNFLLNIGLDGTILSTEELSPDPGLVGYEAGGLAFDDNTNTLWLSYSRFFEVPYKTIIYYLDPAPGNSCQSDFDDDGDVDGSDVAEFAIGFGGEFDQDDLAVFAQESGRTDCL